MLTPEARRRRTLQAETFLQMIQINRVIGKRLEVLFAESDCTSTTPAQANVLMVLFQARRPLTARQLAEEMAVSDVTMSRFVKALESNGWIERERDPSDARAMLLHTTAKAHDYLPRFAAISNQALDEAFGDMSDERLEAILRVVGEVRTNLAAAGGALQEG